jgi:hypothetical protein
MGLVGCLVLSGCESVVDVQAPAHEPRLVPQGFFSTDSLWSVWVSQSVAYTSAETPGFVEDAEVTLWKDGAFIARFQPADSGRYDASGPLPDRGVAYAIRVEAPDRMAVEGIDSLPPFPLLAGLETRFSDPGNAAPADRKRLEATIVLDDPPGPNRYGVLVLQARLREDRRTGTYTLFPPALFPFESDDVALSPNEWAFLTLGPTSYLEAFFTDEAFQGGRHPFSLSILYDAPPAQAEVVVHRAFAVVVLSVSEAFYSYWTTARKQALANENPFAEPLRVGSNMSGGMGVFAGFQFNLFPIAVDTLGHHDVCGPATPYRTLCESLLRTPAVDITRGLF